jgi:hypothetical protein
MNRKAYVPTLISLVVSLGTLIVHAEPVYKSTMPDGKVLYGNAPAPGARKVEKMTTNTQNSGVQVSTPEQQQAVSRRESARQDEAARRAAEIEQLRNAVTQAEAELKAGKDPKEGELTGNARGGTRLNEEYAARQKLLEENVQAARKRLQEAEQAR